jgi:hypothetical protein
MKSLGTILLTLVALNYLIPYTILSNKASSLSIAFWSSLIIVAIILTFLIVSRWEDGE